MRGNHRAHRSGGRPAAAGTAVADTVAGSGTGSGIAPGGTGPGRGGIGRESVPCGTVDPDLWFAEYPAEIARAQALCLSCPLRPACLAGALERREPWGVWGGEIVADGVVLAYKRGRGRPSHADRARGLLTRHAAEPARSA